MDQYQLNSKLKCTHAHIHTHTSIPDSGWWPAAAFHNAPDNTHTQGSSGAEPLGGLSWDAAVTEQNHFMSVWPSCLLQCHHAPPKKFSAVFLTPEIAVLNRHWFLVDFFPPLKRGAFKCEAFKSFTWQKWRDGWTLTGVICDHISRSYSTVF